MKLHQRKNRIIPPLILIIALFLVSQLSINSLLAQENEDYVISLLGLEAGFPEIRANVRILGADNRFVEDIDPAELDIYENGVRIEEFEIVPAQTLPQVVGILVDSGINTSYARDYGERNFRLALAELIEDQYVDPDSDRIILGERLSGIDDEETIFHLSAEDDPAELGNALENISFRPQVNPTEPFVGLDDMLNEIEAAAADLDGASQSLIFVYHNVNWPPTSQQPRLARTIAEKAEAAGIRVYAIHANPFGDFAEPFQDLAESTGGKYINLAADAVLSDRFNEIFGDFQPQAQSYLLRFKTTSAISGPREIAIVPAGVPAGLSSATGTVEVESTPATILVEAPGTILREGELTDTGIAYSPDNVFILAQVESWPYLLTEADLETAELFVNGVVVQQILEPDPTNIVFDLDLNDVDENQSLILQVRIRDNLGLVYISDSSQLDIEVVTVSAEPEVTPTSEPTEPSDTATEIQPTSTPFVIVTTIEEEPTFIDRLPWFIAGFLLLALIGVTTFFVRRLRALDAGVAREAYQRGGIFLLTRTIITGPVRGKEPLARLVVLQGPDKLIGNKVDIYAHNVNIGRDPRRCDILLYDDDRHASVSALHCIIQFDQGDFKITDASANGTKVNETQLESDLPAPLNDGDEITLGDLFKRGALLKFEVLSPSEENKPVSEKEKASLANLNAIQDDDEQELIEVVKQEENEETTSQEGPADHADDDSGDDDDWMDDLE